VALFAAGSCLAVVNLLLLRATINSIFSRGL